MHTPSRRPELTTGLLAGIFVGGRSRRMHGTPKGLLPSPDPGLSVIERQIRELRALGGPSRGALPSARTGAADIVLVGEAPAYAALGLPSVTDQPPGIGPLGGLVSLLTFAEGSGYLQLLALACDLPYVPRSLFEQLLDTAPQAAAVVPRVDGVLQPLCARYSPSQCLPVARAAIEAGERALFRVVERLGTRAATLDLGPAEAAWVRDWDAPEDMR